MAHEPRNNSRKAFDWKETLKIVPFPSPDFSPSLKKGDRGPIKSIRTREWKCVYYPGNHEGELYNLIDDPGELNNLWYESKHTELKTKLTLRILDWCIETEDRRPQLG